MIRKGSTIGANATVICGTTIGRYALVGAGALVRGNVPDHAVVVGVPARQTGWACECGATLRGVVEDQAVSCEECDRAYALRGNALQPVEEQM